MIRYRALALFKESTSPLNLTDQFYKVALLFFGAKYKMGSENMLECDCSGLICGTLNLMGYKIRVTADEIMNKLTDRSDPDSDNPLLIGCKKDGKYKHIGIGMKAGESEVVYNSSYPTGAQFESINNFINRYKKRGYTITITELDWDKVKELDGVAYGLDKELV